MQSENTTAITAVKQDVRLREWAEHTAEILKRRFITDNWHFAVQ